MKTRVVAVGALAALLVVALWYTMLLKPVRADINDTSSEIEDAEKERQSLDAERRQLEALADSGPEVQARLAALREAVPENPELASFIDAAYAIGTEAGVRWVSVAPTEPVLAGGVSSIQLAINVEGGYFQVLNYLNLLEDLSRLVVIDSVNLTAGTAEGSGSGGSDDPTDSVDGAPSLSAQLTGRMFTQSTAAVATTPSATERATTETTVGASETTAPTTPTVEG
ncbi:MAG: type 4a pilus biogenesis protein PilO [Actinomycetota bacterium]